MKVAQENVYSSFADCHDSDIKELEQHLSKRQKINKEEIEPSASDDFGNPFEENDFEDSASSVDETFSSGNVLNLKNVPEIVIESEKNRHYQQRNSVISLCVNDRTTKRPCILDLNHIYKNVDGAKYQPERFPAVILKIHDPKTTALVFRTGKINLCGSQSEYNARIAAKIFISILSKLGYNIDYENCDFKTSNLVGTFSLDKNIRLRKLAEEYPKETSFIEEIFPGLIFRMEPPLKMCFTVFESGKINVTGANDKKEMMKGLDVFSNILKKFTK